MVAGCAVANKCCFSATAVLIILGKSAASLDVLCS